MVAWLSDRSIVREGRSDMRISRGSESPYEVNSASPATEQRVTYGTNWPVLWPVVVMVFVSLFIRMFDLDRIVSGYCYDPIKRFWPCERSDPWLSFYRYGVFPPLLLGIGSLIAALWAHRIWPDVRLERIALIRARSWFLFLLIVIGPGLLVNGGLKSLWGRPRPLQCQDFGGELKFRQVGEWTQQKFPNSSFPSGHASIAFFLMGPAFIVRSSQFVARRLWFCGGLGYGCAMGATRVLQGGHFLSDVLWAGMIVYVVGVFLARSMFPHKAAAQVNQPLKAAA